MSYSITKNTSLLTGASVLQKLVSFIYFTLVARFLGAENTSQYFLALSFALIFTVVADFGLTPVLTREISKFPDKAKEYLSSMFWVKLLFGLLAYILIVIVANIFNYEVLTKQLIYVAGLTVFFDNLNSTSYAFLRAQKNLLYESVAIFVSQLMTLGIGTAVLFLKLPMIGLILAYTIPSFLNFWVCLGFVYFKYNLVYYFKIKKQVVKWFLIISLPFALAGIINRLYSYTDTLIMSKLLTQTELGWWSVPYKIIFAFQFIPSALTISVFPVLSRSFIEDKERVGILFQKAWKYLAVISVPMAFGLLVVAKPFIVLAYTKEYLPAVLVLQIMGFSLIFTFLNYINGALLNAINKQKLQTTILFFIWILSTILNIILIPQLGIYGAAITSLATNIIFTVTGYYFVAKFININHNNIFNILYKIIISAGIMAVIVFYLENIISFWLAILIGILVYSSLAILLKIITIEDIKNSFLKLDLKKKQI